MLKKTAPAALDLFVTVPDTTLPGGLFVPSFEVGKYHCSKSTAGKAQITADCTPWNRISFSDAKQACADAGYKLITESQYLALAYQIAATPANWTGGEVGKGTLRRGLHKWSVSGPQAGTYAPSDREEARVFYLPNGDEIFDVAGNIYSWTFDDIQGDANGLCGKKFAKDSPSIVYPYPGEDKHQGWVPMAGADWSGDALIRGGLWSSRAGAGVFRLDGGWRGYELDGIGFRCTK